MENITWKTRVSVRKKGCLDTMKKIVLTFITTCLLVIMGSINVNAAEKANINVKASNATPKVGDTVTVTVSFSKPLTSAEFSLSYNESVLEYKGDSISSKDSDAVQKQGNTLRILYVEYGSSSISSATFTFKVKGEGESNCKVSNITLLAGERATYEPSKKEISAKITVAKTTPPPATPDPTQVPTQTPGLTTPDPTTPPSQNQKTPPPTKNPSSNKTTPTPDKTTPTPNESTPTPTPEEPKNEVGGENTIVNENNEITEPISGEVNEIENDSNTLETEENKPNYMLYVIIAIIAVVAISAIAIVIIKRNHDDDEEEE